VRIRREKSRFGEFAGACMLICDYVNYTFDDELNQGRRGIILPLIGQIVHSTATKHLYWIFLLSAVL
jgi:hypothetical protein